MQTAFEIKCFDVSIHTPVWGVTHRAGGGFTKLIVSIHTPVWGVTHGGFRSPQEGQSFNPHPRMGGDSEETGLSVGRVQFQSTPPYGG